MMAVALVVAGWLAFASVIETLVDKFGGPGLLVIFVMYMIIREATDEQRHALIDMYLLGRGMSTAYPIIIMGALFLSVLLAQRYYYSRKVMLLQDELVRIGTEKSSRQEQAIGARLHHAPATAESKR